MKMNKSTKLFALICILVVFIGILVGFMIKVNNRDREIREITAEIAEIRSGEKKWFNGYIPANLARDKVFQSFLVEQTQEMCQNREYRLLYEFLNTLDYRKINCWAVVDAIQNYISSAELSDSLELIDALSVGEFYYNESFLLNRNSGIIADYINANGINPITFTVGEGYYATSEDESGSKLVGISGSPLHDSYNTTYFGDFQKIRRHGVRLDDFYEETSYSNESYYFRDCALDFDPTMNECVWSGDYLFSFASDGELLNFTEVTK